VSVVRGLRDALVIVALCLALSLLLGEISVRILDLTPERPAERPLPLHRDPSLRGLPVLTTIKELRQPNVRGVHYGVLHRTNSRGLRGPEYSPEPEPGTFRIVLVGDSIAMGHRVDEAETYAARLERSLNSQSDGVRFEVLNAALSGLSVSGVVRRLVRVGLPYRPNLVVYGYSLNDIYGRAYVRNTPEQRAAFRREYARFEDSPLHLMRLVWPGWISLRSAVRPMVGSHEYALERAYFDTPAAWMKVAIGLGQLAEISEENGICVDIFIQTILRQLNFLHPFRRVYDRVEAASKERGLEASQSFETFVGHDEDEVRFSPADMHPTSEGHRLFAIALEDALRRLPSRCGFPPLSKADLENRDGSARETPPPEMPRP